MNSENNNKFEKVRVRPTTSNSFTEVPKYLLGYVQIKIN